jgi:hypothetical protein
MSGDSPQTASRELNRGRGDRVDLPVPAPQTLVAEKPGDRFTLDVTFVDGRKALPVVTLRGAA